MMTVTGHRQHSDDDGSSDLDTDDADPDSSSLLLLSRRIALDTGYANNANGHRCINDYSASSSPSSTLSLEATTTADQKNDADDAESGASCDNSGGDSGIGVMIHTADDQQQQKSGGGDSASDGDDSSNGNNEDAAASSDSGHQ